VETEGEIECHLHQIKREKILMLITTIVIRHVLVALTAVAVTVAVHEHDAPVEVVEAPPFILCCAIPCDTPTPWADAYPRFIVLDREMRNSRCYDSI
jgi:hypothetical protein